MPRPASKKFLAALAKSREVTTKPKTRDPWPVEHGLPVLRDALERLRFVEGCLNDEADAIQADALFHVRKAVEQAEKAIAELEQP